MAPPGKPPGFSWWGSFNNLFGNAQLYAAGDRSAHSPESPPGHRSVHRATPPTAPQTPMALLPTLRLRAKTSALFRLRTGAAPLPTPLRPRGWSHHRATPLLRLSTLRPRPLNPAELLLLLAIWALIFGCFPSAWADGVLTLTESGVTEALPAPEPTPLPNLPTHPRIPTPIQPLDRALLARQAASARNLGWENALGLLRDNFHWVLLAGICLGTTGLRRANERRSAAAEAAHEAATLATTTPTRVMVLSTNQTNWTHR